MDKKTPIFDIHTRLGGTPVPFAGYLLPIQYKTGIIKEHLAVREKAGLFDCSHMGEFLIAGKGALAFLSFLLVNDFSSMQPGMARYSPMCNDSGGVVDDLLVYKKGEDSYMLVVNASNKEKDFAWIEAKLKGKNADIVLNDISDKTGLIALQGPAALSVLKKLVPESAIPAKNYTFTDGLTIAGKNALVSRTGYTGEDGFEFYTAWDDAPAVYEALLATGEREGLIPCGLGARDTLRLEAAMPLYGHEMNDEITPVEAGLGFFVKFDKPDFVGKAAMLSRAPEKKRIGLELIDKGIAREHSPVLLKGEQIGEVSSGTLSPVTGKAVAMALIDMSKADAVSAPDAPLQVDVRGRLLSAKAVQLPFYKRK